MRSIKEDERYCIKELTGYADLGGLYWPDVKTEHLIMSDAIIIAEENTHRVDGKLVVVRQHTRVITDIIRVIEKKEKVETLQIEAPKIDSALPPGYTGDKDVPF